MTELIKCQSFSIHKPLIFHKTATSNLQCNLTKLNLIVFLSALTLFQSAIQSTKYYNAQKKQYGLKIYSKL